MQQIAGLLQKNKNWSRGRNWVEIAKECRKVLMKELDFNKCRTKFNKLISKPLCSFNLDFIFFIVISLKNCKSSIIKIQK